MPALKSKSSASILLLFLWVSLSLSVISALLTTFYVCAFDFYEQYLSIVDSYFSTSNLFVYYIEIIVFLIWLFQLHKDLKGFFSFYPVSPWGSLLRMIPIINFWGMGSTFGNIGKFIRRYDDKLGQRFNYLIPILYVSFFGLNYINRWIKRSAGDVSDSLIITGSVFELAFSLIVLALAVNINRGMLLVQSASKDKINAPVDPKLNQTVTQFMEGHNSISSSRHLMTDPFVKEMYAAMIDPNPNPDLTPNEMFEEISRKNRRIAELVHYIIHDYHYVDDETFEVHIYREFTGGTEDEIRYTVKKVGEHWMFDRMEDQSKTTQISIQAQG